MLEKNIKSIQLDTHIENSVHVVENVQVLNYI